MQAKPRLPDASVNLPRAHPLGEAAFLVLGVGVLIAVALALVAFFVELVVWLLPYDMEARLAEPAGEAIVRAQSATDGEQPATDPRQAKLQALLDDLAGHWPDNPYGLRVAILEEEMPNAFAVPGGVIFVTEGLLDGAESENEVAFVLGHEVGHFRGRDHLRAMGRGALVGVVLAAAGLGGESGFVSNTSQLLSLRYDRDQERAADRFGLELLHARYGHVNGSAAFFARVERELGVLGKMPSFVQTHPASRERIAALRRLAEERGYGATGALNPPL